ncbi:HNH endonuclease [Pseudidiomarina sp.]|uniref:HNH endonuclease n=1 Tax=Pseudidiomarina sp. TaxID=2081707 RepID=UPI003A97495D
MCSKTIQKNRLQSAQKQHFRCYYCGHPMWHPNDKNFARKHHLSPKQARWFRCTAEHVHAKCDGGSNEASNIVAACWLCNQRRHRRPAPLAADAYRELVTQRVSEGKWFPNGLRASG